MAFFIILTFFDRKIGPLVFYSYPISNIEEDLVEKIARIMDLFITEGFMSFFFDRYHSLNYYFEIESTWARGKKETLMLSAIFDGRVSFEIEKAILTLCIEFSDRLKNLEDIFKGFYNNDSIDYYNQKNRTIIDENSLHIRSWVEGFYEAILEILEIIQEKIVEEKIPSFIEEKDVFLTLKFLIFGPITYEILRDWYSKKFPDNNFYKLMIKLIKNHMITIPLVGKSKTPPFNVYIDEDIRQIINLISLKNKLLKRFINKRQRESSETIEKRTEEQERYIKKRQKESSEADEIEKKLAFKVVMFGDQGVGKNTLISRSAVKVFKESTKMTIGADFSVKNVGIDQRTVALRIWDLARDDLFKNRLAASVKGADGAIIIYDVTKQSSLTHVDDWILVLRKEIKSKQETFPVIVVGNKADLEDAREVSRDDGIGFAKSREVDGFVECSFKTWENVEEMFDLLIHQMLQRSNLPNII
jgi:small GTP-binding protein